MGSDDDAEFLRALEDLQGLFHGQEEKGESLYAFWLTFLMPVLAISKAWSVTQTTCTFKLKL